MREYTVPPTFTVNATRFWVRYSDGRIDASDDAMYYQATKDDPEEWGDPVHA